VDRGLFTGWIVQPLKGTAGTNPTMLFFIHHQTPHGRAVAAVMPTFQHQYQVSDAST